MTDRATLTRRYLDQVTSRGLTATELLGPLPGDELLNSQYHQRYLPRPQRPAAWPASPTWS